MKLGDKLNEMVANKEITEGESTLLSAALEHLDNYTEEFEPMFGGYSDLELNDLGLPTKSARGHLSSLTQKGLLQVHTQDVNGTNHQFIHLTEKSYNLLQEFPV